MPTNRRWLIEFYSDHLGSSWETTCDTIRRVAIRSFGWTTPPTWHTEWSPWTTASPRRSTRGKRCCKGSVPLVYICILLQRNKLNRSEFDAFKNQHNDLFDRLAALERHLEDMRSRQKTVRSDRRFRFFADRQNDSNRVSPNVDRNVASTAMITRVSSSRSICSFWRLPERKCLTLFARHSSHSLRAFYTKASLFKCNFHPSNLWRCCLPWTTCAGFYGDSCFYCSFNRVRSMPYEDQIECWSSKHDWEDTFEGKDFLFALE